MSVAESVQYPWERALTDPNKVPYYVKYAFCISEKKNFLICAISIAFCCSVEYA